VSFRLGLAAQAAGAGGRTGQQWSRADVSAGVAPARGPASPQGRGLILGRLLIGRGVIPPRPVAGQTLAEG